MAKPLSDRRPQSRRWRESPRGGPRRRRVGDGRDVAGTGGAVPGGRGTRDVAGGEFSVGEAPLNVRYCGGVEKIIRASCIFVH